jgi:hypothetical protein
MRTLEIAQQHLTSVLDRYLTTSEQDERGSQVVPFFFSPWHSVIQCTVYTRTVIIPNELSTVYFWYTVLYYMHI